MSEDILCITLSIMLVDANIRNNSQHLLLVIIRSGTNVALIEVRESGAVRTSRTDGCQQMTMITNQPRQMAGVFLTIYRIYFV